MNPIAQLFVSIGADTSGVKNGLADVQNMMSGAASKLGAVALGVGAAGVTALAAGLWKSVEAASEAEQVQAQLNAVLKSTGGAAGVSAETINKLASNLQDVTKFEDDAAIAASTLLLQYENINKDVFPDALKLSADLAERMGTDLTSAATVVGRALDNPAEGIGRLNMQFKLFTDEQMKAVQAMAEAGDVAGAQARIMDALKEKVGGAAEAAGGTFAGKLAILQNKLGDVMETIGGALIPILTAGAQALIDFMANPQVQAGVAAFVTNIQNVASAIGGVFASLASGGGGDLFGGIFAGLQGAGQGLMDWVTGSLAPALSSAFAQIAEAAGPTFAQMGEWINGTLLPALQQLGAFIGPILAQGFALLGQFITTQAIPALTALAVWVLGTGLPALGELAGIVGKALVDAFKSAQMIWALLVIGFQKAGQYIEDAKTNFLDLADALLGPVTAAFQWFMTNVLDPIKEALAALRNWISLTIDALNKLGGFVGGSIPNPFGGGKAGGGPVSAGTPYLVGERGPEMFVPRGNGTIVPAGAFGGGGVTIVYAPTVSLMDEAEAETKLKPYILAALREALG